MRGKRARAIRKLAGCDLSKDGDVKEHGYRDVGTKYIGQISHDGNHGVREETVFQAMTTEDRYLYRQMKRVWKQTDYKPEIRAELVSDLKTHKEDK